MTTPETFQRGELVEVSDAPLGPWRQRVYLSKIEGAWHPFIVATEKEFKFFKDTDNAFPASHWTFIRKIPQPKKVVLKAPAIRKDGSNFKITEHFYSSYEDAKFCLDTFFHSFPATIRLPNGESAGLWFEVEE